MREDGGRESEMEWGGGGWGWKEGEIRGWGGESESRKNQRFPAPAADLWVSGDEGEAKGEVGRFVKNDTLTAHVHQS